MRTKYNGPGSLVLHTKVNRNQSTGSKEKDFEAFYHLWERKPTGHVTKIIFTYFNFLAPKSLHTKFGQKGQAVSVKNKI